MIVFEQDGFAIDWNWSTELAVWSDNGARLLAQVATHTLPQTPKSERQAIALARRWWRREGRASYGDATPGLGDAVRGRTPHGDPGDPGAG